MIDVKPILLPALLVLALAGCGSFVERYTPMADEGGARGYAITAIYGPLDGTQEGARQVLTRESSRLCGGDFKRIREQNIERVTAWGTPNGQYDLTWEVRCKS